MPAINQLCGSGTQLNDGLNCGAWGGRVYHPGKSHRIMVPSKTNGCGCGNQMFLGV